MFGFLKRIAPVIVFSFVLFSNSAFSYKQFGGEIPWPLSVQHVMTVKNSKGLWRLNSKTDSRLFNVEMSRDDSSGFDWIRVSELDSQSYEVISWGEGLFTSSKAPGQPNSSFTSIDIGGGIGSNDSHGRYLSMFPNGDFSKPPYIIRIVEVESSLGNVLGLSMFNYVEKKFDHMLGSRVMTEPLGCVEVDKSEALKCYFDL